MGCGASANYKLTQTEQLRLETNKGVQIIRGPQAVYLSKMYPPLKEELQSMVMLEADDYAIIRDTLTTSLRVERGEKRFFLCENEELVLQSKAICLSQTEYCVVVDVQGKRRLEKGPASFVPSPYETPQPKQDAIILDANMYVKVQHQVTGAVRVERGPQLVFPDPSEQVIGGGPQKAIEVDAETCVMVRDTLAGTTHLVQKRGLFFPRAEDEIVSILKSKNMVKLNVDDYAVIRDTQKNTLRVERGEQRFFLQVHEELVRQNSAIRLSQTEYCYVDDGTGALRLVKGPTRFFPGPYEATTSKKNAIMLDADMYVKVQQKASGELRVDRGPKLVFPEPTEQIVGGGAQKAVHVDTETAVLVRDTHGALRLVEEHGLFFPRAEDNIVKVQSLIKLSDHEAIVVKDEKGAFRFFYGDDERRGDQPRAFFLPPYCEIVEHLWSRGRRRETRTLRITHLDTRPQFMNFEFNSRTSDNVELILEGTFYWQLVDIIKMMSYSSDVTGDICNYARSTFIQEISKVTLQEFMDGFRNIANKVIEHGIEFYTVRGIKVHSLEVSGYRCADSSTAEVLQQIIQETTNRMNRASQQESENELAMMRVHSKIEHEKVKGELLEIQQKYLQEEASAAGKADAERASQFLKALEGVVPDPAERVAMWNVLRKGDALGTLAAGSAHLYFTPSDVNLSIEDRGAK